MNSLLNGLDGLLKSDAAMITLGVVTFLALFLGLPLWLATYELNRDVERASAYRRDILTARTLWLSECDRPLDVCAAAWDDGSTLQSLYLDRVRGEAR